MDKPPPRRLTAAQWRDKFEAEGLRMHPRDSTLVNMEVVDAIKEGKNYSDLYLAEKSKELMQSDKAPKKFGAKTLQRARKMNRIHFGSAYTIAMILECDVRDVAFIEPTGDIDDEEDEEDEDACQDDADHTAGQAADDPEDQIASEELQNPDSGVAVALAPRPARTRIYTVSNIIPEISWWLRLLALDVVLVSGFYCLFLALGGYEWLRVAFPLVHGGGAFAIAYIARSRGRFPMPINLRVLIGLVAGVLTGMVAFFAIAVMAPERLVDFESNRGIQAAMILYIAAGIFAFMAGHELASRRRTRPLAGPGRRMFHWSYPLAMAITGGVAIIGAANITP